MFGGNARSVALVANFRF